MNNTKRFLVLMAGVALFALSASADNIASGEWNNGDLGSGTWVIDAEGQLIVSGTGATPNYTTEINPNFNGDQFETSGVRTFAPWGQYSDQITSISVKSGITELGARVFFGLDHVTNVNLSEGLQKIGISAFDRVINLTNLTLPDSVNFVDYAAFAWTASLIALDAGDGFDFNPRSEMLPAFYGMGISIAAHTNPSITKLYCNDAATQSCEHLKSDYSYPGNLTEYAKENGVYVLDDIYYASAGDMMKGADYTCGTDLDLCKEKVLENKGLCSGDICQNLVSLANSGKLLKVGSKTYQSLDALLKGNYDRRRIYTIEEANFVAGDKNRVSIKYR